jgi:mono/diheme cytochrome c family protein
VSRRPQLRWAVAFVAVLFGATVTLYLRSVIRRGFSAREAPSKVEEMMARTIRNLATPEDVKNILNPQAPTPENIRDGLEHFADHCAVCHANNGSGDTMFGRGMYPKPPDMRTEVTQNLSDGELYSIIQNGIRLTGMPAFGQPGKTNQKSTWNLVLFIRHLPKLTPQEEVEMKRLNPAPPPDPSEGEFLSGEDSESHGHSKRSNSHQ